MYLSTETNEATSQKKNPVIFEPVKFNVVHVPCSRMNMQYLTEIAQTADSDGRTV